MSGVTMHVHNEKRTGCVWKIVNNTWILLFFPLFTVSFKTLNVHQLLDQTTFRTLYTTGFHAQCESYTSLSGSELITIVYGYERMVLMKLNNYILSAHYVHFQ